MVFLVLLPVAVAISIHPSHIKLHGNHVNGFLILLVVLVLILDINNIVKELLDQSNQMTINILQLLSNQMTINILPLRVWLGCALVEQLLTDL